LAHASAQTDSTQAIDEVIINGKHYKAIDDKKIEYNQNKKRLIPLDSEWVEKNKRFRYYNNWLTLGAGVQQNLTYKRSLGFVGGINFNFHIKRNYFQTGLEITGEKFGYYNNYQVHAGYVRRWEDKDYQFSAAAGLSYSKGFQVTNSDSANYATRSFNQPGLYIAGEVIKKVAFDVGLGAMLFADLNQEQSIIGFRFLVYFSGSYKGKKYLHYGNEY
jgi:hypothetical protein